MTQQVATKPISPKHLHEVVSAVRDEISRVIIGQHELIDRLLIALFTNNHALIEGVPGLAKTLTVQSLAEVLSVSFSRLQFTPDLLPADIVGTLVFNPRDSQFVVRKGPIFTHIVLADEINRAPAKVQSALLEAMQERQASIGGETHPLPNPFLVLATQNPIEQEGTYPLPEAQLDRFMMKIVVDYPRQEDERSILAQVLDKEPVTLNAVATTDEILAVRPAVEAVEINEKLRDYILRLVHSSREPARYDLNELAALLEFGASPRAVIFLARAAQGIAFLNGRDYATPDDVKQIAPDVLRHRVVLSYEAESENITSETIVANLLEVVRIP